MQTRTVCRAVLPRMRVFCLPILAVEISLRRLSFTHTEAAAVVAHGCWRVGTGHGCDALGCGITTLQSTSPPCALGIAFGLSCPTQRLTGQYNGCSSSTKSSGTFLRPFVSPTHCHCQGHSLGLNPTWHYGKDGEDGAGLTRPDFVTFLCFAVTIIIRIFDRCTCWPEKSTEDGGGTEDERAYKRVAIVEEFFHIIYNVHVEMDGRGGKHAGQKRTYRARLDF
ncbi:hypothetical protein BaRGS_00004716 [Batillaria attramentaria]|uniref:Secreted protein n=1 Tax=Batillaria attramentaria TaxID=370345 RepID=A0ABD0LWL1_9CAEN